MLFAMQNGVLKFAFETHVHMVLLRIILALKVFQKYRRQRAFFSKCDVKLEVYCNYCGRCFDQAATLSLRGPAQFTHEARSAEFDGMGWMDGWMGLKDGMDGMDWKDGWKGWMDGWG